MCPFLHAELQVNEEAPIGNGHLSQSPGLRHHSKLWPFPSRVQFPSQKPTSAAELVQSTHWIDKGSSSYILPKICPSGTLTRLLESALGAVWRVGLSPSLKSLAVLRWLCLLQARLPHFSVFLTIHSPLCPWTALLICVPCQVGRSAWRTGGWCSFSWQSTD